MATEKIRAQVGFGRRLFIKAAGSITFCLSLPSWLQAFFEKTFYIRTVERENFSFDPATGRIEWFKRGKKEPYELIVAGLVEKPMNLSYKELLALPATEQVSDFHCVEGWSVADVKWGGFRFDEIVKRVKPKPEASHVLFHALGETEEAPEGQDHYIESFSLNELLAPEKRCLMALTMDDKPLSHDHGSPLRVVAPFSLGYKNIKFVMAIQFVDRARPGWWTLENPIYPIDAPVPEGRLRKR